MNWRRVIAWEISPEPVRLRVRVGQAVRKTTFVFDPASGTFWIDEPGATVTQDQPSLFRWNQRAGMWQFRHPWMRSWVMFVSELQTQLSANIDRRSLRRTTSGLAPVLAWEIPTDKVLRSITLPQSKYHFVQDGELVLPEYLTDDLGFHSFTEDSTRQYTEFAEVADAAGLDIGDLAHQNVKGFWGRQFEEMDQNDIQSLVDESISFIETVYEDIKELPIGTVLRQVANAGKPGWFEIVPRPTASLKLSWDVAPDQNMTAEELVPHLVRWGFTDGSDASPEISLLEYGVLRNPETGDTVLYGAKGQHKNSFDLMRISTGDVQHELDNMSAGFFTTTDISREQYRQQLATGDAAIVIQDLALYSDAFATSFGMSPYDVYRFFAKDFEAGTPE